MAAIIDNFSFLTPSTPSGGDPKKAIPQKSILNTIYNCFRRRKPEPTLPDSVPTEEGERPIFEEDRVIKVESSNPESQGCLSSCLSKIKSVFYMLFSCCCRSRKTEEERLKPDASLMESPSGSGGGTPVEEL